MRYSNTVSAFAVSLSCLLASACGQINVKDVHLNSFEQDQDIYASVQFDVEAKGMRFPTLTLPVKNPNDPSTVYGTLSIIPGAKSVTAIKVDVDLTEVAKLPSGEATLPNGSALPVNLPDSPGIVQLPLGDTNARLYIAMNDQTALVGLALPIKELGGVSRYLGTGMFFLPFSIPGGIEGTAGLFSGEGQSETGLGLFVDAGELWKQVHDGLSGQGSRSFALSSRIEGPARLSFPTIQPSKKTAKKVQDEVRRLQVNNTGLSIE